MHVKAVYESAVLDVLNVLDTLAGYVSARPEQHDSVDAAPLSPIPRRGLHVVLPCDRRAREMKSVGQLEGFESIENAGSFCPESETGRFHVRRRAEYFSLLGRWTKRVRGLRTRFEKGRFAYREQLEQRSGSRARALGSQACAIARCMIETSGPFFPFSLPPSLTMPLPPMSSSRHFPAPTPPLSSGGSSPDDSCPVEYFFEPNYPRLTQPAFNFIQNPKLITNLRPDAPSWRPVDSQPFFSYEHPSQTHRKIATPPTVGPRKSGSSTDYPIINKSQRGHCKFFNVTKGFGFLLLNDNPAQLGGSDSEFFFLSHPLHSRCSSRRRTCTESTCVLDTLVIVHYSEIVGEPGFKSLAHVRLHACVRVVCMANLVASQGEQVVFDVASGPKGFVVSFSSLFHSCSCGISVFAHFVLEREQARNVTGPGGVPIKSKPRPRATAKCRNACSCQCAYYVFV
jgi:hypothetical protein